jgi:hypothetical protein
MSGNDARDRRALTLLVQLFGREVLDRVARAGFDDETSIARAGADRLAAESGISMPVAQRIVAVVEEIRGPSSGTRTGTDGKPRRPASTGKAPTRRPVIKVPSPRLEKAAGKEAAEDDPFVDDVALVTWMGFTSRTSSGRLPFSVADGILDPRRREAAAPEGAVAQPSITPASETPSRAPAGTETAPPPRTLPGSFWSFGRPAEPGSARDDEVAHPPGRRHDSEAPAGAPPRRNHDDH